METPNPVPMQQGRVWAEGWKVSFDPWGHPTHQGPETSGRKKSWKELLTTAANLSQLYSTRYSEYKLVLQKNKGHSTALSSHFSNTINFLVKDRQSDINPAAKRLQT